jgi:uncharacterized protein (TIRG00374 family)
VNDTEKKPKSIKIPIIVSLTLSFIIIILILIFTINPAAFNDLLRVEIRYEYFLGAILFNISSWCIWGVRLQVLSNSIDKNIKIGIWESTKIVITNLFLAGITPSMAGGEPVRIHLLNKEGMSIGGATAAVLGERLIDAIFILTCVPLALFIFKDRIVIETLKFGLSIGVIVFIIILFIFFYMIKNPGKIKHFLIFLDSKFRKFLKKRKKSETTKIITTINNEVDNFHNSMIFFIKEGRKAFFLGGILSVFMWSLAFMVPPMILLGLGLDPFIIESYAAQILLLVIIMMPLTPGSCGITEVGAGCLFSVLIHQSFVLNGHPLITLQGFDQALLTLTGVFIILFRFITYHMNLIAGAIFQYKIFKSVASFSFDKIKKT